LQYPLKFTVFTPTYNRAGTLERPYKSLCNQTFRDFEWLVVDDGSNDETPDLVEKWRQASEFPVRYLRQANLGKPTAFNLGVNQARGELFLNLDSDDSCTPDALERLLYHWESIPAEMKPRFSAVTALCQDQHGRLIGTPYPKDILDSDSIELSYKYKVKGEKFGFQCTDVLKQFPFPVDPEHKFVSESVVWTAISRRYKTRFVNETLRTYWIDDGAADHLTTLRREVLYGRTACHRMILNELIDWFPRAPWELLRSSVNFSRYSFDQDVGPAQQLKQITPVAARLLWLASLPLGYAMSLHDRKRI
jgi:glycosyltransferase involved in cell wall biosynthesis